MISERRKVLLAKKLWDTASDKQELKRNIGRYMSVAYPDYEVVEVHKYYAICEKRR